MKKLPISVIIPLKDDRRIFRCIQSIDADVEIIVVLNGKYDKNIATRLEKMKDIKLFRLRKLNFAKIYNIGIRNATRSYIFFMDSDCIFVAGALEKLMVEVCGYPIVKGNVAFQHHGLMQRIIARTREFTTTDTPNLFIPGPLFYKAIFDKVGVFNENIAHCADNEMFKRIEANSIRWKYLPDVVIKHDPLDVKNDLRSAYNYGIGRYQRYKALDQKRNKSILKDLLSGIISCYSSKGILVAVYYCLWIATLNISYLLCILRGKYENHKI